MQSGSPFTPRASNQTTPAGTASGAVTGSVTQISLPNAPYMEETVGRFVNSGTQTIFWAYGSQASLSTSNGVPMLPNTIETFTLPAGITQLSVIAGATGSTLYITAGDGM